MRGDLQLRTRPFHELLNREIETGGKDRMIDLIESQDWPKSFTEHVVKTTAGDDELVVPLGIFFDSAQYGGRATAGRERSVLVISFVNLASQQRHPGVLFRKHLACKCGCRGYCSYERILRFVHWNLKILADGKHPCIDMDGVKLTGRRAHLAGTPLGFKGACTQIMADWEGICQLGYVTTWAHNDRPCPLCTASKKCWHKYRMFFLL